MMRWVNLEGRTLGEALDRAYTPSTVRIVRELNPHAILNWPARAESPTRIDRELLVVAALLIFAATVFAFLLVRDYQRAQAGPGTEETPEAIHGRPLVPTVSEMSAPTPNIRRD